MIDFKQQKLQRLDGGKQGKRTMHDDEKIHCMEESHGCCHEENKENN